GDPQTIFDRAQDLKNRSASEMNEVYQSIQRKAPAPQSQTQQQPSRTPAALPAPSKPSVNPGPVRIVPAENVDPALYMKEYAGGRKPSVSDLKRFKMMGWDRIETTSGDV